jgi:chromosome segregation ATPase
MTAPSTLKQSHDVLKASISDLAVLRDQLAGIDDIKVEQQKAQAQLDALKHNVKGMKIEFDEVKREHDKILAQAHEKLAECERLDAEIKKKREDVSQLSDYINKIKQRLG